MILSMLITRMICNGIYSQLHCTIEEPSPLTDNYEDEERKLSEVVIDYPAPKYIRQKAEKKCGWCQRSNRQESLFPCGKFGISLMVFEFQMVLSSSLLGLIALCWYEAVDIRNYGRWPAYILLVISILVYLYILIYVIPVCLRRFMLVTNVSSTSQTLD